MKIITQVLTGIVMLAALLNTSGWPVEFRFVELKYNYIFVSILCIALPVSIFLSGFTFEKRYFRFVSFVLSFSIFLPCALVFFFSCEDFKSLSQEGVDYSFEKINEIEFGGSNYRLYRSSGGAATSFGLVLRKETPFIRGVNTVKVVFSKYKAFESTLSLINNNTIEMRIEPYNGSGKAEVVMLSI